MELFSPRYRKRFIFGILLFQLRIFEGENLMAFFSTQIFDEISGNGGTATLLMTSFDCGFSFFSLWLTKTRRKVTYTFALIASCLSMLLMALGVWIGWSWLSIANSAIFLGSFAVGNGAMLNIYISEFLPLPGIGFCIAGQ